MLRSIAYFKTRRRLHEKRARQGRERVGLAVTQAAFVDEFLEVLEAEVDRPLHEQGVSCGVPQTGVAGFTDPGRLHPVFRVGKQLRQIGARYVDRLQQPSQSPTSLSASR